MEMVATAVVLREFNQPLDITSLPVPDPAPGAIIARVSYGGVCGTDVHLHHGSLKIPHPLILGHEGVGTVAKLGDGVTHDFTGAPLQEGDAIAWMSNISCGKCHWCVVEGRRTLCQERKVYGVNQALDDFPGLSGSWADMIYLQPGSAIFKLTDVTPVQAIALGCAGPTAFHGVIDVTGVEVGDTVVVQGCGPVGIASAMYAHLAGAAKVILLGAPASRLELAKELGIGDVHLDLEAMPDAAERIAWVRAQTPGGRGATVVLECAGVPPAVPEGWEMAAPGARCLVLGQYTDRGPTPINPHIITRKELKVLGSWGFAEKHYQGHIEALPLLAKRFDLERLVTTYPLVEANAALADMAVGRVMKPLLVPAG